MCQDFRVKEKPKFYNPVKPELGLTINTGYPIHWSYLIIKIPCSKFGKWQKPFFEINICTQSTTEISLRFCKFLFLNSGSNWRSIRLTDWPKRQTHKNTPDKGLTVVHFQQTVQTQMSQSKLTTFSTIGQMAFSNPDNMLDNTISILCCELSVSPTKK